MKIKVSYKGNCLTLGYIKKTNNLIIGWYLPDILNINFINETVQKRDFHVTYPRDGNTHFSYKYFDPITNFNFEKRVYFDAVIVKRFDEHMMFLDFEKQPRNDDDLDQHLVIRSKPLPLDDDFKVFLLPLPGHGIGESLFQHITQPLSQPNEEDIIVDLEGSEGRMLNIGFAIYKGNENDFFWNMQNIIARKKVRAFGNIYIESYLLVAN